MIASVSGSIQHIGKDNLVLNNAGIGIRLYVPRTVLENLGGIGKHLSLHTHLIVRETELTLYGFKTEDDLSLFTILLTISGIGPKMALAILSTLSPELLKSAIIREEAATLQRVPGIGKKTAERIMFQLRDKLDLSAQSAAIPLVSDIDADVIDVLTSLGFSIIEAQTVLQKLPRDVEDVNQRVQLALQQLDQFQT